MQVSPSSRRWLASAALQQISESPASDSITGAIALHQLLTGTPAESDAHELLHHLKGANTATTSLAESITLTTDGPAFP